MQSTRVTAATTVATTTAAMMTSLGERALPVAEVLAPLLPGAGLVRGRTVGCSGVAASSLALALVARATADGSWLAVVGLPSLGVEAAGEHGVAIERLVAVDADPGRPGEWAERVAAAADGFDLVLAAAPVGAERALRRVRPRLQARGSVLVLIDPDVAGLDLAVHTEGRWEGLGDGHGRLRRRRVTVTVAGRRSPRPVTADLWLPGPSGALEPVVATPAAAVTSDPLARTG